VDLDGALAGHTANAEAISEIVKNVSIGTEIGGGIRTMEDIKSKLNLGLNRVIIGTKAVKEPQFIKEAIEEFGADRVVIGIDAKDGMVAIEGWETVSDRSAVAFALEMKKLGAMTRGEKVVLCVFALAVVLWVFSPQIRAFTLEDGTRPLKSLTDAGIAMGCGLALFALPIDFRRGVHALSWDDCKDIPWDVLLLFGGGLSMAAAIQSTGGSGLIGAQAVALANLPEYVMIIGVAAMVIFATEVTSNTALTAAMLPILAAAAPAMGMRPEVLLLTTAIGASAAFMMPVATPPNAIIFGTGRLKIAEMIRAGFWLNVISVFVIGTLSYFLSDLVLKI
jgi:anion transporter